MKGRVSIVIPTFNRLNYLKNAVKDARQQSYTNLEIIIVDDASTKEKENQEAWIKSVQEEDNRILYVQNSVNTGFVKNINSGIKMATGNYIHIFFDDDSIDSKFIEKAVKILEKHPEVALVQLGAHNSINGTMTHYHPRVSGLIHKWTYLYNLYPHFNCGNIGWSVSPCNYVFRNKNIYFRNTIYEGFQERQLMRGSGYDILFILDNFGDQEYLYHIPSHLCTFNSHIDSCSMKHGEEVLEDTKKGIVQYIKEKKQYGSVELAGYLTFELFVDQKQIKDMVNVLLPLINKYNLSIYELKDLLYSHNKYNISWTKLKDILDSYPDNRNTVEGVSEFLAHGIFPSLSLIKYVKDKRINLKQFNKNSYVKYLIAEKFKLNGDTKELEIEAEALDIIQIEKHIISSRWYKERNAVTFCNVVRHYWTDFCEHHMKKLGLIFSSNHLRYIEIWKSTKIPNNHKAILRSSTWRHKFVQYLLRSYSLEELKMHGNKDIEHFEHDLYYCKEYADLSGVQETDCDLFEEMTDLRKKVWEYTAIPICYTDLLYVLRECNGDFTRGKIRTVVSSLNFEGNYYNSLNHFYRLNDVFGEGIVGAIQISGHLRFYDKLYESLSNIKESIPCDTFVFTWNDSMGIRYKLFEETDVTKHIQRMKVLFEPKKLAIENNDEFITNNVWSGGFPIMEADYCSYPTIKSQYYSVYRCNRLRQDYEQEKGMVYDIVIKMRFDGEFDPDFTPDSLFNIYFSSNFGDTIYVSHEKDHGHTGGHTGCYWCNLGYWLYNHNHKHYGQHYNDICDFIAISSPTNIDYYSSLYDNLEEYYKQLNPLGNEVLVHYQYNNKVTENGQNIALLPKYNHMYKHFIIKPDTKEEYRISSETPWYPEALLRIYLEKYRVIANRYFRIKLITQ